MIPSCAQAQVSINISLLSTQCYTCLYIRVDNKYRLIEICVYCHVCLNFTFTLSRESLNNDGQQFHESENQQSPLVKCYTSLG